MNLTGLYKIFTCGIVIIFVFMLLSCTSHKNLRNGRNVQQEELAKCFTYQEEGNTKYWIFCVEVDSNADSYATMAQGHFASNMVVLDSRYRDATLSITKKSKSTATYDLIQDYLDSFKIKFKEEFKSRAVNGIGKFGKEYSYNRKSKNCKDNCTSKVLMYKIAVEDARGYVDRIIDKAIEHYDQLLDVLNSTCDIQKKNAAYNPRELLKEQKYSGQEEKLSIRVDNTSDIRAEMENARSLAGIELSKTVSSTILGVCNRSIEVSENKTESNVNICDLQSEFVAIIPGVHQISLPYEEENGTMVYEYAYRTRDVRLFADPLFQVALGWAMGYKPSSNKVTTEIVKKLYCRYRGK